MSIRILSDETVNKIAAGEVVERPANAVKELLENSLDANSSIINISVEKSGKELILIKDALNYCQSEIIMLGGINDGKNESFAKANEAVRIVNEAIKEIPENKAEERHKAENGE